jgi:hypothetical protein
MTSRTDIKSTGMVLTGNLIPSRDGNLNIFGNIFVVGNTITTSNLVTSNITITGNLYVPGKLTGDLYVSGNIFSTGDITGFSSLSDARLKTDIKSLDGSHCLHLINSLRPVEYLIANRFDAGLVAQEVANVSPHVIGSYHEFMTVKYEKLVQYLIGAIQELDLRLRLRP